MKQELMSDINAKIAISLNKLLEASRSLRPSRNNEEDIANSYNKIALNADIRKATVSDTFNGKSVPTTVTLILIVEGMGYKLSDFALIYESIKEIEIKEFQKSKKQN
ncbi:MAG: hypothetical protein WBA61_08710 [Aequorivita sp.]